MPIVPSRSARIQELLGRLASGGAGRARLRRRGPDPPRGPRRRAPARHPPHREPGGPAGRTRGARPDRGPRRPRPPARPRPGRRRAGGPARDGGGWAAGPTRGPPQALAAVLAGPAPASRRRGAAPALVRLQAAGLVEALDPLAARLLDEREDAGLRVAILDALRAQEPPLAPATLRPLLRRLAASADPQLAARARSATDAHVPLERLVDELVLPGRSAEAVARTTAALARRGAAGDPGAAAGPRAPGPAGPRRRGRLLAPCARRDPRGARRPRQPGRPLRPAGDDREPAPRRHARAPSGRRPGRGRLARSRCSRAPWRRRAASLDACAEALAAIVAREKLRKTSAALQGRAAGRPQRVPSPLGDREGRPAAQSPQPARRSAP